MVRPLENEGSVPDIFDEAESDYRTEQMQLALRRYGWLAGVALLLVLAGAGLWQYVQVRHQQASMAAAAVFLPDAKDSDTLVAGDKAGRTALASKFQTLAATAPAGYRTLARLRAAALLADAGKLPQAQALWDQVSSDPDADPLLRNVASLLWVMRSLDTADPNALRTRLVGQTSADDPFHLLALEQQALLELREGQTAPAAALLRQLVSDPGAPTGLRGRDGAMLQLLSDG
jgi:hypothetical protein